MCILFSHLHLRSSTASVVFDFNDSLNDIAPVFSMLLAACMKRNEKDLFADVCHSYVSFCKHNKDQVQ